MATDGEMNGRVPAELLGTRKVASPRIRLLYLLVALLYLAWTVVDHRISSAALAVVWLSLFSIPMFGRPTRVDADGVRLSRFVRGSSRTIGWEEIDSVVRPASFDRAAILRRVDGGLITLTDVPAAQARAIAEIGRKPLTVAQTQPIPRDVPARPASVAEQGIHFDRRVAELDADRRRMAEELDRIRGHGARTARPDGPTEPDGT